MEAEPSLILNARKVLSGSSWLSSSAIQQPSMMSLVPHLVKMDHQDVEIKRDQPEEKKTVYVLQPTGLD